jgi:hypothetical protein
LLPPPPLGATLASPAATHDVLANAVVGSLLDEASSFPLTRDKIAHGGVWRALRGDLGDLFPNQTAPGALSSPNPSLVQLLQLQAFVTTRLQDKILARFSDFYRKPPAADPGPAYEARVLHGIWATAPYLHNGSVPNLWELLKPAKERKPTFKLGSRVFDFKNVGYDTEQSPFPNGTFITDPDNANGNGNGGHEYGTELSEDDRWAIIEYMKGL